MTSTTSRRTAVWPARRRGCSATRRGVCPLRCRIWPTAWYGSRATAAPKVSTWRPQRPCASTLRPGLSGGLAECVTCPDLTRGRNCLAEEMNRGHDQNERHGTYRTKSRSLLINDRRNLTLGG